MGSALRESGRRIVYSINPNSSDDTTAGTRFDWSGIADVVYFWGSGSGVAPRITATTRDGYAPRCHVNGVPDQFVDAVAGIARSTYRSDPDMLVVGVGWSEFFLNHRELLRHSAQTQPLTAGQRAVLEPILAMPAQTVQWLAAAQPSLTEDEQRSHFSLWAMLSAPLLVGNDLRSMSPTTVSILANREVIAVDQDPLMAKAQVSGDGRIWAKQLADSSVAVALFNSGGAPADIATTAATVGLPSASCYTLRDLWASRNATTTVNIIANSIAPQGVPQLRVKTAGACSH